MTYFLDAEGKMMKLMYCVCNALVSEVVPTLLSDSKLLNVTKIQVRILNIGEYNECLKEVLIVLTMRHLPHFPESKYLRWRQSKLTIKQQIAIKLNSSTFPDISVCCFKLAETN